MSTHSYCSAGTLDLDLLDQTMATLSVSLTLLGASFWEQVLDGGSKRWSGVSSIASTVACLGGMVQWVLAADV
jgi:hypothetical protein